MRIVLLSHYYYPEVGAPQRRWRILVDHLRAAGHDVITVAPHPHYPYSDRNGFFGSKVGRGRRRVDVRLGGTWDTGVDGERILRVPYLHSGSSMARQLLDQTVSATGAMSAVVDRLRGRMRPDVIVSTTPALPFLLAGDTLSRLLRVPHIAEVRDAWPDLISEMNLVTGAVGKYLPGKLTQRLEHRLLPDLLTRAQRRAAVVVVTTEGFKRRLEQRGVTAEVVRSGVSPAELEGASGLTATGAIPVIPSAEETGTADDNVNGRTPAEHTWAQPAVRGHCRSFPGSQHLDSCVGPHRRCATAHCRRRRRYRRTQSRSCSAWGAGGIPSPDRRCRTRSPLGMGRCRTGQPQLARIL